MSLLNQLKLSLTLFLGLISAVNSSAQDDSVIYENEVYVDYIQAVTFHISNLPTSFPIVGLSSGSLTLSFDDMGGSFYDYTYHIVHCTKDWEPSDINEIEYLDGYNGELIEDFTASENTYVDYTHYSFRIPNRETRLKISGNYLLIVNDEGGLPIITRRFIVVDPKITVMSEMKQSPNVEFINSHQAVNFHLVDKQKYLSNPNDEVFVSLLQNGNWDTAKNNLKPHNINGSNIYFNNRRPYIFPGGKEFRNFDIRNLEGATRNVHSVDLSPEGSKAILEISKNRYYGNYVQDNDANGTYVIDNQNDRLWQKENAIMENSHRGAISGDYVDVYFTLKTMELYDQDVYMIGGFSDWKIRKEYKMTYDNDRGLYKANTFFKQGYYNYYFAAVDETGKIDMELLEGNHNYTENDYMIFVYQRSFGKNYDEVIGLSQINSTDN